MGKKTKFDKLNEWIKKEYDRETQEIEDSLSKDGSFDPNRVNSEELFRRIQAGIKEREEQKEEQKREPGAQQKKVGISRYQVRKWAALFFVTIIGVFLASMTSEANRSYLMYKIRYLVGDEIVLDKGNAGDAEDMGKWQGEKYNRQEAEEKLGIPIPDFQYKLELNTEDAYNIQYGEAIATVEYEYDDNIVNLRMINRSKADTHGIDFQGEVLKKIDMKKGAISVIMLEVRDEDDEKVTLAAQWEYQEGYYQLSGKIEEDEFINILKNIAY